MDLGGTGTQRIVLNESSVWTGGAYDGKRNMKTTLLVSLCFVCGTALSREEPVIPAPEDMTANVIVSGHTSTAIGIDVACIGEKTPPALANPRLGNAEGVVGYVSKHFFLRTDFPAERARHMLELLELAYPHYVEAFGLPADMGHRRLACGYGSSYDVTMRIMKADGFGRGPNGGGEAMFYNNVAYCFPCGAAYHDRYILLHECAHAFSHAAQGVPRGTPVWYDEGMADGISDHLFEPDSNRLTVFVLNTRGGHDWLREGLNQASKRGQASWRGLVVLQVHYLMKDPLHLQKFRAWRDEMYRIKPSDEAIDTEDKRLREELYGAQNLSGQDYGKWIAKLRPVVGPVTGPWRLGVANYAIADDRPGCTNRMVLQQPPGEPLDRIYSLERIGPPASPLAGPARCGTDEPAVGCLIEFQSAPPTNGFAGMGLGFLSGDDRKSAAGIPGELRLAIAAGRSFVVEGLPLGVTNHCVALSDDAVRELANTRKAGIMAVIKGSELRAELRVGKSRKPCAVVVMALSPDQKTRILTKPVTLSAMQADCKMIPCLDESQRYYDLSKPAPANLWRNPADHVFGSAVKASWRLGTNAPPSLQRLVGLLRDAADKDGKAQEKALSRFNRGMERAVRDIAARRNEAAHLALTDLSGLTLQVAHRSGITNDIVAIIRNPGPVRIAAGSLRWSVASSAATNAAGFARDVRIEAGGEVQVTQPFPLRPGDQDDMVNAEADLEWCGTKVCLAERTTLRPREWLDMKLEQDYQQTETNLMVHAIFSGHRQGEARGAIRFRVEPGDAVLEAGGKQDVAVEPRDRKRVSASLRWTNGPVPVSVTAEADMIVYDEKIWLRDSMEIRSAADLKKEEPCK